MSEIGLESVTGMYLCGNCKSGKSQLVFYRRSKRSLPLRESLSIVDSRQHSTYVVRDDAKRCGYCDIGHSVIVQKFDSREELRVLNAELLVLF